MLDVYAPRHRRTGAVVEVRQRRLIAAVLIAAVVVVGAVAQGGTGILRNSGLVASPERYVALSFASADELPHRAAAGQRVRFTFLLNATMTVLAQRWVVAVAPAGRPQALVAQGTAELAPGHASQVAIDFPMPAGGSAEMVTVRAPGQLLVPLHFAIGRQGISH